MGIALFVYSLVIKQWHPLKYIMYNMSFHTKVLSIVIQN